MQMSQHHFCKGIRVLTHTDSLVVPVSLSPRLLLKQILLEVDARLRRAAARFNAIIVPFGGVGSADNAPRHFDSTDLGVVHPTNLRDEARLHSVLRPFYATISCPKTGTDWRLGCG